MCVDCSCYVYDYASDVIYYSVHYVLLRKRCLVCKRRSGCDICYRWILCGTLQEKMHGVKKMAANLSLPGSMVRDNAWYGKEWMERFYSISHNYSDYCPIFYLGKHISQILKNSLHITGAVL